MVLRHLLGAWTAGCGTGVEKSGKVPRSTARRSSHGDWPRGYVGSHWFLDRVLRLQRRDCIGVGESRNGDL